MKQFELIPLKKPVGEESPQEHVYSTRMCVDIDYQLAEKVKDYAYWKGLTRQQVLYQALTQFMNENPTKERPPTLKNRKVGRSKKQLIKLV
jgi:hypothetical protein